MWIFFEYLINMLKNARIWRSILTIKSWLLHWTYDIISVWGNIMKDYEKIKEFVNEKDNAITVNDIKDAKMPEPALMA